MHSERFLSYSEKRKSAKMTTRSHSLSFVATCCHLLSLVVIPCQSLPFAVIRCTTRCHSMYHSSVFVYTIHFATRNLKITSEIKKRKEQDISNKGSVYQFHLFKEAATTGVFVWTFQNFEEHLFYRTRLGDCFCVYESTTNQFVTSKTSLII